MKVKGSYTVEAALVCPFVCLVLCAMIAFTLSLYREVRDFSQTAVCKVEESRMNPEAIRLLQMLCKE